jgi:hypothetical protein
MKDVKKFTTAGLMKGICAVLLCLLMLAPADFAQAPSRNYRDSTVGFMGVYTVLDCTTPCTTTNTSVTPVDVGVYASGIIIINVTAVSGTSPSLTVNFQVCDGNASAAPANTNCVNHTTGSAITATGLQIIKIDHFPRYITVTSTISGTTPSFTFTVKGYFKPQS